MRSFVADQVPLWGNAHRGTANYDARCTYGKGPKGEYRHQTTDVGSFPANAWGLQDMHGNVREWCEDQWHRSYEGAPRDGLAWIDQGASYYEAERLLRGGSWDNFPRHCRSASRDRGHPGFHFNFVGFSVCCLPPGSSS